ncbi:MAG TPA: oxygenase MpaB family protein, partial [Candidatus Limnocylindrales bacterium]|nr:oxygenase MpaB family protein [Candidatus Limnocylindrales bacterium]
MTAGAASAPNASSTNASSTNTSSTDAVVVDGGFYGPGSEAWRLNREAMLLLGAGPRALLLQVAHPLVAAGVTQHSHFRDDPWARLSGTLRSYLRIVYGSAPAARDEIRRLNELHRGIRGAVTAPDARARHGARYSALDPQLSLWVHATLVDSTIAAYDAWIEPLSAEERARYYEETLPVGRAFGIPASQLPPDVDAFDAYVAGMLGPDGPVRVGDEARELADAILHPPLGPAVAAAGPLFARAAPLMDAIPARAYGWLFWPSIGLLPAAVRDGYGLPWGFRQRAVAGWLVAAWQAWRPMLP